MRTCLQRLRVMRSRWSAKGSKEILDYDFIKALVVKMLFKHNLNSPTYAYK